MNRLVASGSVAHIDHVSSVVLCRDGRNPDCVRLGLVNADNLVLGSISVRLDDISVVIAEAASDG
jgi:hypothetical protein